MLRCLVSYSQIGLTHAEEDVLNNNVDSRRAHTYTSSRSPLPTGVSQDTRFGLPEMPSGSFPIIGWG